MDNRVSLFSAQHGTVSYTHLDVYKRQAKEDRYFVYSFKIECIPGYTYPWAVSISNAYMKIRKKSDGTHETIPGTAIGRSVSQIQPVSYTHL